MTEKTIEVLTALGRFALKEGDPLTLHGTLKGRSVGSTVSVAIGAGTMKRQIVHVETDDIATIGFDRLEVNSPPGAPAEPPKFQKGDLVEVLDDIEGCNGLVVGALHVILNVDERGFVELPVSRSRHDTYLARRFRLAGRPRADGWTDWFGGPNPAPGKRVEVRTRNLATLIAHPEARREHNGMGGDHMAFRIVDEKTAPAGPVMDRVVEAAAARVTEMMKADGHATSEDPGACPFPTWSTVEAIETCYDGGIIAGQVYTVTGASYGSIADTAGNGWRLRLKEKPAGLFRADAFKLYAPASTHFERPKAIPKVADYVAAGKLIGFKTDTSILSEGFEQPPEPVYLQLDGRDQRPALINLDAIRPGDELVVRVKAAASVDTSRQIGVASAGHVGPAEPVLFVDADEIVSHTPGAPQVGDDVWNIHVQRSDHSEPGKLKAIVNVDGVDFAIVRFGHANPNASPGISPLSHYERF